MSGRAPGLKLSSVTQIGIVVRDAKKTAGYYGSVFGWGPFRINEHVVEGTIFRGRHSNVKLIIARAHPGPIEIELMQVIEGETPFSDFLERHGEGVQHLRFHVDNLAAALAEPAMAGIEPEWRRRREDTGFAFLRTRTGDMMLELTEGMLQREGTNTGVLPPLSQIGLVVKDLGKTIDYFGSRYGWGPFEVFDRNVEGTVLRGKPIRAKLKQAVANLGPVGITMVEVTEGETLHSEFLERHGEGVHHFAFFVADLKAKLDELAALGIEPVWSRMPGPIGRGFAYLDTGRIGGTVFELIENRDR